MKRYFTQYWTDATWESHREMDGQLLNHTAGNVFRRRGVGCGDSVYVVTVREGRLYLIGRLAVHQICSLSEAKQILRTDNLWDAQEHIIAASATPMRFDFEVPTVITEHLLFVASGVSKPLRFDEPGHLDQQTLRPVRELEPASARLLDKLLPSDMPTFANAPVPSANDLPDGIPGKTKQIVYRIIRDTKKSRQIKEEYQFQCQVCGKRLEITPGVFYAESHHIQPLGGEHKGPDVRDNILCLCPNHHALFDYFAIPLDPGKLRLNKHELRQSFVEYHNAHFRSLTSSERMRNLSP
jgi:hypothetical protein